MLSQSGLKGRYDFVMVWKQYFDTAWFFLTQWREKLLFRPSWINILSPVLVFPVPDIIPDWQVKSPLSEK